MDAKLHVITVDDLLDNYNPKTMIVLDVREQQEIAAFPFKGVNILHIPMREVPRRLNEIDASKHVIVVCHSGGRSGMISDFLSEEGYATVYNLIGGIIAWEAERERR